MAKFATMVYRMRRADGQWRWIQIRERPFDRDRRDKLKAAMCWPVASDVSEHFRLQQSLATASGRCCALSKGAVRIAREIARLRTPGTWRRST